MINNGTSGSVLFNVNDETERLALEAKIGDYCYQEDNNKLYIYIDSIDRIWFEAGDLIPTGYVMFYSSVDAYPDSFSVVGGDSFKINNQIWVSPSTTEISIDIGDIPSTVDIDLSGLASLSSFTLTNNNSAINENITITIDNTNIQTFICESYTYGNILNPMIFDFTGCTNLSVINLDSQPYSHCNIIGISGVTKLTEFHAHNVNIENISGQLDLSYLSFLETVDISSDTHTGNIYAINLQSTNAIDVNLNGNNRGIQLQQCPTTLSSLKMSVCGIATDNFDLSTYENLTYLDISSNGTLLTGLTLPTNTITYINASSNGFSGGVVDYIFNSVKSSETNGYCNTSNNNQYYGEISFVSDDSLSARTTCLSNSWTLIYNGVEVTSNNSTTFTELEYNSFTITTNMISSSAQTISIDNVLPDGVSFSDNGDGTATISGTPAAGSNLEYDFNILVNNHTEATQSFKLYISSIGIRIYQGTDCDTINTSGWEVQGTSGPITVIQSGNDIFLPTSSDIVSVNIIDDGLSTINVLGGAFTFNNFPNFQTITIGGGSRVGTLSTFSVTNCPSLYSIDYYAACSAFSLDVASYTALYHLDFHQWLSSLDSTTLDTILDSLNPSLYNGTVDLLGEAMGIPTHTGIDSNYYYLVNSQSWTIAIKT